MVTLTTFQLRAHTDLQSQLGLQATANTGSLTGTETGRLRKSCDQPVPLNRPVLEGAMARHNACNACAGSSLVQVYPHRPGIGWRTGRKLERLEKITQSNDQ